MSGAPEAKQTNTLSNNSVSNTKLIARQSLMLS